MKPALALIACALAAAARAEECPVPRSAPWPGVGDLPGNLRDLSDVALNSSVSLVNRELEASVEKRLGSFKVSTQMLALRDPSKEALADWYFNMVSLNKLAFEEIRAAGLVDDESAIQRLSLTLVNGLVARWVSHAFSTTLHEKAHAEAALEAKAGRVWFWRPSDPGRELTIGELFQELVTEGGPAATHHSGSLTPEQTAAFAGAGLNHQALFAERLAQDSVERGQFHHAEFMYYILNKVSVPLYYLDDRHSARSDIRKHANALVAQGKLKPGDADAAISKMAAYSTLSALLSGRTWEGLSATMGYVAKGDPAANTLKVRTPVGDITWPEFSTYLNSDNVSVKAGATLVASPKLSVDLAVEKSVIGAEVIESSVAANVKEGKAQLSLTGLGNSRGKFGAKFHLAYDIGRKGGWFVNGGAAHDTGTLDGRRLSLQTDDEPRTRVYSGFEYRFR